MAEKYHYTVNYTPAPEGGYVVTVPALPGLVTEADTRQEARRLAKEAILGYLESLQKHGEEIPTEPGRPITEHIAVSLERV